MNYSDATCKARRLAKKHSRTYYVIRTQEWERETPYDVADDLDLEGFYSGTPDSAIVYCTADD